ncbi:MAG: hypothetical protein AAB486_01710 [Patescibacteria group bacterium]
MFIEKVYAVATNVVTNNIDTAKIPYQDLGQLVGTLLQVAIIISGLAAFIFLLLGGFQYVTSGGEKAQAEAARDKITYAIIGMVIIAAAYAGARVIETIFGVSIVSGITWPGPGIKAGQ